MAILVFVMHGVLCIHVNCLAENVSYLGCGPTKLARVHNRNIFYYVFFIAKVAANTDLYCFMYFRILVHLLHLKTSGLYME